MKQKPRILFICPTVASYIGGTETVVAQLAHRLKHKVQLTVLSGISGEGKAGLIEANGFELHTLPFIGRDTRLNQVLSKLLMTSRFKIESYSFFNSLKKSGLNLEQYDRIITFYEADAYLLSRRYASLNERSRHFLPGVSIRGFFRHVPASHIFLLGYRAAPKIKARWDKTIESLPLGVDSLFFSVKPKAFPADKKLVYIGRLDGSKHVDWLISFFQRSGLAQKGFQLDIVGDGPLLADLLRKYKGAERIRFHGRKNQDEVVSILQESFLLLHPSDHESFGLTILESMAAGVPVITHELSSVKAWAKDHPRYVGYLDEEAWKSEILKFEYATYWEQVRTAGREHARFFTWDEVSEQVLCRILRME